MTHAKRNHASAYEYKPDPPLPKKSYKDPESGVITGPKNFLAIPMKKGVMHGKKGQRGPFFDNPGEIGNKYEPSDYNIEKKILREELAAHKEKLQEMPFYPLSR